MWFKAIYFAIYHYFISNIHLTQSFSYDNYTLVQFFTDSEFQQRAITRLETQNKGNPGVGFINWNYYDKFIILTVLIFY